MKKVRKPRDETSIDSVIFSCVKCYGYNPNNETIVTITSEDFSAGMYLPEARKAHKWLGQYIKWAEKVEGE